MNIKLTYEHVVQGSIQRTFLLDSSLTSTLTELPYEYEKALIAYFDKEINELKVSGKKFNFVMDLTNLPLCICYTDTREIKLGNNTVFDTDMQSYWRSFSYDTVIIFIYNLSLPYYGVKRILV